MMLSAIATGLENRDGIWYAKSKSDISYPDQGNTECYQVEDSSFWFKHRNACLTALIKRFPPTGSIFDIGGANGCQAQALVKAGFDVVLVEPGMQAIQHAKQRGLKNLVCTTLQDAQFIPNTLPAVGLFDVLEHIVDAKDFLQTIYTILQSGGRLYITVPAYQWLWSNEDRRAGHYRRYTTKSLRQSLSQAGFEIEFVSYFFSILPLPIYLTRTLPSYFQKVSMITPEDATPLVITYHHQGTGLVKKLSQAFFTVEANRIARGQPLPFGSSCLAVVKKPTRLT